MAHDDQFTALGPSNTGSGFPRTAFSTHASDMVYGVNVAGERCGVYGESALPVPSDREADVEGVGVFGVGKNFGVFGKATPGIAGVFGQHNRSGIGIIGAAIRGGGGVVGASVASLGNPLSTFAPVPDPADGTGTGVFGTSGAGAGVRGSSRSGEGGQFESGTGVGVSGSGFEDRGGVFDSGKNVAQIRLVPLNQDTPVAILPKNGKVGDLLLIRNTSQNEDGALIDQASLWLCTPGSSVPG